MKLNKGFTLIEMMIVVAILGILAAIAVPAYQGYISSGRCAQVTGPVHSVMVDLVGDFAENGTDGAAKNGKTNDDGEITINGRVIEVPNDVLVEFKRTGNTYEVKGSHPDVKANECKNPDGSKGDIYVLEDHETEGTWK